MARASYAKVLGAAGLCYTALGAVLPLLPRLSSDPAAVGVLVGAPALTGVLTRPAGGRLADRIGPAPVMLAGAAVMSAGAAPALASTALPVLLGSRLAVGAGEGAMMSAAALWLLRLAGSERRGRALGHVGLANYAGLTAGGVLAGLLGDARTPILVAAALLPPAGALVARRADQTSGEAEGGGGGAGVLHATLGPGIALALVNLGYVALLAFGATVSGSQLLVPVFAAGVILARTAGAGVVDRLGARRTVAGSTALAALGLTAIALAAAPAVALAATAVVATGQGLAVPALGVLAIERVPAARHGAAAGLFFAFFDAGVGAGGPLVGGAARLLSPAAALALAGAGVAGAGVIGLVRPRRG